MLIKVINNIRKIDDLEFDKLFIMVECIDINIKGNTNIVK